MRAGTSWPRWSTPPQVPQSAATPPARLPAWLQLSSFSNDQGSVEPQQRDRSAHSERLTSILILTALQHRWRLAGDARNCAITVLVRSRKAYKRIATQSHELGADLSTTGEQRQLDPAFSTLKRPESARKRLTTTNGYSRKGTVTPERPHSRKAGGRPSQTPFTVKAPRVPCLDRSRRLYRRLCPRVPGCSDPRQARS